MPKYHCKHCSDELEVLWSGDKFTIVCTGCLTELFVEDEDGGLVGGGLYMANLGDNYCFCAETVTQSYWTRLVADLVEPSRSNKNDLSTRPGCPQCGAVSSLNGIFVEDKKDEPDFALCGACDAELIPPGGKTCLGKNVVNVEQDVWDNIVDVFKKMIRNGGPQPADTAAS